MNKLSLILSLITSMGFANEPPDIIIIFTDDHGFADLSIHGQVNDTKTAHIDRLSSEDFIAIARYITEPQWTPSRAGLFSEGGILSPYCD